MGTIDRQKVMLWSLSHAVHWLFIYHKHFSFCYQGDAWEGELCSAKTCPGEDGPCNGHGTCNAIVSECTCDPGWQGDDCGLPQCLKDCSGKQVTL